MCGKRDLSVLGAAVVTFTQLITPSAVADDCTAQWNQAIGNPGANAGINTSVLFDDGSGSGPALYVGGTFSSIGGISTSGIARWDGHSWSSVGGGIGGTVLDLAVFDDGSGPALYVGGVIWIVGGPPVNGIARWDGNEWSNVGGGVIGGKGGWIEAMAVYDDGTGPGLYVAGHFEQAGGVPASSIARWGGPIEGWSDLQNGMQGFFPIIHALEVFDDYQGSGPALFAGGYFDQAGAVPASRIARWDGPTQSWSSVGSGMSGDVITLATLDIGDGPALYAGGVFTMADGVTVNRIARWDGNSWSGLGCGMNHQVRALAAFDDGDGLALYAGGMFVEAGCEPMNRIARWNGTEWSPVNGGLNHTVNTLIVLPDELSDAPALLAAGTFTAADDTTANSIAIWQGCPVEPECGVADLNCDGVVDVFDLLTLLSEWGSCADPADCSADLNGDGVVDVFDLLILLSNWG